MTNATFPADVVGVIAEFAVKRPEDAFRASLVSSVWLQGVQNAEQMWNRLTAAKWGGRVRSGGYAVFLARMKSVFSFKPMEVKELHAIEDCDFAFRCPLVAEALKPTGRRVPDSKNPILHCSVCKEDVYVVSSQEELDQRRAERRCVAMMSGDLKSRGVLGGFPITLYSNDPVFSQRVLATLKHQKVFTRYGLLLYSINFSEGMTIAQGNSEIVEVTVVDSISSDSIASSTEKKNDGKRPSTVLFHGSLPPFEVSRGIPMDLIISVREVKDAVNHLCRLIDACADDLMMPRRIYAGERRYCD